LNVRVTALLCPRCAGHLAGLRYDVAFTCRECNVLVLFDGTAPRVMELYWALPQKDKEPAFYLPVWLLRGALELEGGTVEQRRTATGVLSSEPSVFVTAFQASRSSTFGDLGQLLTKQKRTLLSGAAPASSIPFGGLVLGPVEALRFAELFALQLVDQRRDVTGMKLRLAEPSLEPWAVPLARDGAFLEDLATGARLPALAVDDLEELLAPK
jgi:hypothetical protein